MLPLISTYWHTACSFVRFIVCLLCCSLVRKIFVFHALEHFTKERQTVHSVLLNPPKKIEMLETQRQCCDMAEPMWFSLAYLLLRYFCLEAP